MTTDKLNHAITLTRILLNEHNLIGWGVDTNRRNRSFGLCSYRTKTISFSSILIPNCTEEAIWNTVTHEVAHAIAGHSAGHGYAWQRIHKQLGGNAERCGGDDNYIGGNNGRKELLQSTAKYIGRCPNGHEVFKFRIPKNDHSCGKCSPRFDRKHLITYSLNV